MNNLQFVPKGGMCKACKYVAEDCRNLDFKNMYRLADPDENKVVIVKCIQFNRQLQGVME